MDLTICRFDSLSEADSAESEYLRLADPQERLNVLVSLIEMYRTPAEGCGVTLDRAGFAVTGAQSEQNQGRPVAALETSVPGVFGAAQRALRIG